MLYSIDIIKGKQGDERMKSENYNTDREFREALNRNMGCLKHGDYVFIDEGPHEGCSGRIVYLGGNVTIFTDNCSTIYVNYCDIKYP